MPNKTGSHKYALIKLNEGTHYDTTFKDYVLTGIVEKILFLTGEEYKKRKKEYFYGNKDHKGLVLKRVSKEVKKGEFVGGPP